MTQFSPSIEQATPIIKDFDCAMADFACSLERQVAVAEAVSHALWDLLDGRWFKPEAVASDIEMLRNNIVALGMRATASVEALNDHASISYALNDAAPTNRGAA